MLQNVKAVFDAAIRVVIKPPQKEKETKKKQSHGCLMSVPSPFINKMFLTKQIPVISVTKVMSFVMILQELLLSGKQKILLGRVKQANGESD